MNAHQILKTVVAKFELPRTAEEAKKFVVEQNRRARARRDVEAAADRKRAADNAELTRRARAAPRPATPPGAPPRPGVPEKTLPAPIPWTGTLGSKVYAGRNRQLREDAPAARGSSARLAGEVFKNRNGDGGAA